MYTIYYTENDSPEEVRIGMVSAPDPSVAQQIAEMQFTNSRIVRIKELCPPEDETRYPGARFIKGKFHPVPATDEMV